jgi:hypothetical protein
MHVSNIFYLLHNTHKSFLFNLATDLQPIMAIIPETAMSALFDFYVYTVNCFFGLSLYSTSQRIQSVSVIKINHGKIS